MKPGAGAKRALESLLKDKSETDKLLLLRKQIEMRVLGFGWTQFATKWSAQADCRIGTVAHLSALLVDEILPEEAKLARENRLPTEAAPPHHTMYDIGQLGTADADALAISSKALFSAAELKRKAEVAMQRRLEAGISDHVEGAQALVAPAFDQALLGKRMEVTL